MKCKLEALFHAPKIPDAAAKSLMESEASAYFSIRFAGTEPFVGSADSRVDIETGHEYDATQQMLQRSIVGEGTGNLWLIRSELMNVETIVNDVKARGEVVVARGQEVVESGFETLKAANAIVVEGVKTLVDTNVAAGKDLLAVAQTSFNKVKADGVKAVAANPVAYLPEGKDRVVAAYNDSVAVVTKTSDELVKTLKQGYETISAKIAGEETLVTEAAATAKKTVKKAASKTKKAIKA